MVVLVVVEIVLPVMGIFAGPSQDGLCVRHITVSNTKPITEKEKERERVYKQENTERNTEMPLYADIV